MEVWNIIASVFGVVGTIAAIVFAYIAYSKGGKKESSESGENRGVIASDIGYIKAGVDDLKRESRETRADVVKLGERVTRCEESCKQAHKRIDEVTGNSRKD